MCHFDPFRCSLLSGCEANNRTEFLKCIYSPYAFKVLLVCVPYQELVMPTSSKSNRLIRLNAYGILYNRKQMFT